MTIVAFVGDLSETPYPIEVEGVAADIVLAVLSHQREINQYAKGAVEYHWGPNGLRGLFHPVWEDTVDPALLQHLGLAPAPRPHAWPRGSYRGPRAVAYLDDDRVHLRGTEVPPWGPRA